MNDKDLSFMSRALELAIQGKGRTSPNPMSGAVIVKDGQIVGEGFHPKVGMPHAEIYALEAAGARAEGGTIYLTIEPCTHHGKTPPCVGNIINAGIKRAVIAMQDPNPITSGKGIEILRNEGIDVVVGLKEKEAKYLNEVFIKYILTKRPFINMLSIMTLDGKIATSIGDSHWISCEQTRNYVQELRYSYDAVMVGVNTVFQDNPRLDCKIKGGKHPLKIILDSRARTPLDSKIFLKTSEDDLRPNIIVAVTKRASNERIKALQTVGAEVIFCSEEDEDMHSQVNLKKLISILGKRGITSILMEGGGILNASALDSGIVDKLIVFIAPKIIGGKSAPTPVEGEGVSLMTGALPVSNWTYEQIGTDLKIEGYLNPLN